MTGVWLALALAAPAEGPRIEHDAVACVVADKFPQFRARIVPPESIVRARIAFRAAGEPHWYSVALTRGAGDTFIGVLPKPEKKLRAFDYYLSATDSAFGSAQTSEFHPFVESGAAACKGKAAASSLASAAVKVEAPAGAGVTPSGFSSAGLAGAAAGGGISAVTVLAVVGGGAAAAGVAVAAGKGGGGSTSSTTTGSSNTTQPGTTSPPATSAPPSTLRYDVVVTSQNQLDVTVCAGRPTTFGGGPLDVTPTGAFDMIWSVITPVLRVQGQLNETNFQASLTCTSGGPTGSMTANGSGGRYTGSFNFATSQGSISVTRR